MDHLGPREGLDALLLRGQLPPPLSRHHANSNAFCSLKVHLHDCIERLGEIPASFCASQLFLLVEKYIKVFVLNFLLLLA